MNTSEKVGIGLGITGLVVGLSLIFGRIYLDNREIIRSYNDSMREIDRLKFDSMRAKFALDTAGITERGRRYPPGSLPQKYELIDSRGNNHEKLDGGKRRTRRHRRRRY
jgi:hypothetical protein